MRHALIAVLCLFGLAGCTSYNEIVYSSTTVPVDECTFVGQEVALTMEGKTEVDATIVEVRPDTLYATVEGQDTVSSLPLAHVSNIRMPGIPWPVLTLEVVAGLFLDSGFLLAAKTATVPLIAFGVSGYLLVDALTREGFTFRRVDNPIEPVFAPGEQLTLILVSKPKALTLESVTVIYRNRIVTLRRTDVRIEHRVEGWRITVPTRLLPAE